MEKSYYVITCKPACRELFKAQPSSHANREDLAGEAYEGGGLPERMVIAITQGGFGQDVIDDERQAKERFLEYLFVANGIDLPRSEEAFDEHFDLERVDELIDLDEEQ
jgi:hypothetical protein